MMEIQELNIISSYAAGMTCLQNPSLFSRFFSLSGTLKVPQAYYFWKWGAVILTIVATFSAITTRIKLLILRLICKYKLSSTTPTPQLDYEYESDEDDSCSSASSEDNEPTTPFDRRPRVNEDPGVAGSRFYRDVEQRRQWQPNVVSDTLSSNLLELDISDRISRWELVDSKSIVKLWDSPRVGLEIEEEEVAESVVLIWDLSKNGIRDPFSGGRRQIPAVSIYSPMVIFSAGWNNNSNVLFAVHDIRIGSQISVLHAEWRPRREKVYVRDDGRIGALMVGDMRNVKTPLEDLTDCDGNTWWGC